MTDRDDDKQLSRRERRRAQQEAPADERPEDEDEATESEDEGSEEEGDADQAEESDEGSDQEAETESDEEAEAASEEEPPAKRGAAKKSGAKSRSEETKPSKAERKRAKQEERSATAAVRDRNKRLREQAAQRRRGKRERERDSAVAQGLDASEMVDDVLARGTHKTVTFVRRHFNVLQWVVVLGIAGGIGWSIYSWRTKKTTAQRADVLMTAVDAELARVQAEAPANPDEAKLDPRPTFATENARLEAAQKAYESAAQQNPGSGTAILAKLGLAGVLYDEGKFDEAKSAYESVRGSELAKHDADVRLRALEGVGLCAEAKGDADAALKSFEELEKSDEPGFGALGLYHQARVLVSKGDKTKAKELLDKVQEKLNKERSPYQTGSYLERASRDLMAIIDPSTAPVSASSFTPEQLDVLKEQIAKDPTKLKKMLEDMGKLKAPSLPMPAPMPEAPPEPEEAPPAPSGAP